MKSTSNVRMILPLVAAAVCAIHSAAYGVDLFVNSIEVNQGVQYGSTILVGNNITWVRVKVGITGAAGAVSGVDASLRLTIDGVQQPLPPIFSLNGPIAAPLSPSSANINDTINFEFVPPDGAHLIAFSVEVNPNHNPEESDYSNNTLTVSKAFSCRKVVECVGVPIKYTFNSIGLPDLSMIEPGTGDSFLRGIYHPGEWNYHVSPLPAITWATDINTSDVSLLNTLLNYRNSTLPAAGQPKPNFVFGWFKGNPFGGNGEANGIPGDVAFGNTDVSRFQRTFAHEIGHCWGRSHNSILTNIFGVDVEWGLQNPLNLPQIKPSNLNDIMVAGLLTSQAWVAQSTFDAVHNDSRMQCGTPPPLVGEMPVLRISGVIDRASRAIVLDPITRFQSATPTANDPGGDTTVILLDDQGHELTRVTVNTASNPELCERAPNGRALLNPKAGLYVMVPETIAGRQIHAVRILDVHSARMTGEVVRSRNAPTINFTGLNLVEDARGSKRFHVQWAGTDADGDPITCTILYSGDHGASWDPVAMDTKSNSIELDAAGLAHSGSGIFRIIATDGMNITTVEATGGVDGVGENNAPATFLLTPNSGNVFPQHANIALHATSWDVEDKLLAGTSIQWSSNLDGSLGFGPLIQVSTLSPGTHTITVRGTDSGGLFTEKSIFLTITPRTVINPDCNGNGVLDSVDVALDASPDVNGNGIPDECENLCAADVSRDRVVNVNDLLAVINGWGSCSSPCPPHCPADIDLDCVVNVTDLLAVINAWGPCG